MGWERRERGGIYYTQSYREGGKVRRRYIGTGPFANAIARLDALAREEREDRRGALRSERAQVLEQDRIFQTYFDEVSAILESALSAAGYYKHKGQWRKRRGRARQD